jgi:hypothetical protein
MVGSNPPGLGHDDALIMVHAFVGADDLTLVNGTNQDRAPGGLIG